MGQGLCHTTTNDIHCGSVMMTLYWLVNHFEHRKCGLWLGVKTNHAWNGGHFPVAPCRSWTLKFNPWNWCLCLLPLATSWPLVCLKYTEQVHSLQPAKYLTNCTAERINLMYCVFVLFCFESCFFPLHILFCGWNFYYNYLLLWL